MYLYVFLCLLVLVLFSVELICFVSFFYCFLAVLSLSLSLSLKNKNLYANMQHIKNMQTLPLCLSLSLSLSFSLSLCLPLSQTQTLGCQSTKNKDFAPAGAQSDAALCRSFENVYVSARSISWRYKFTKVYMHIIRLDYLCCLFRALLLEWHFQLLAFTTFVCGADASEWSKLAGCV